MGVSQFKVFRDVAQSSSISRGAQLNGISQSAASQLLRNIEDKLETDLLDRSTRPLKLTPAGRIYYEACRDIVRRYEELESQMDSLKTEMEGSVRVASIYSIGLYEMARFKEEFEEQNPRSRVQLEYMHPDRVYQAVAQDAADLGLVSYPTHRKDLKSIPWRVESMVLVCPPGHPLANRETIQPSDLEGLEFISFDKGLSIRKALDRFFKSHGISRTVILEFDNIQMIKEALSIGSAVSILPERTVRAEAADGRLRTVRIETDELVRPVGIIHRRKKKFSPVASKFLDLLKERSQG